MPRFLDVAEVLEIHEDQVTRYGGLHGVRDLVFLRVNGVTIEAGPDELVDLVLGVAEGSTTKDTVAKFLRTRRSQT